MVVLAAVTSLAKPVQGCRSRKLGALRYCATASPAFVQRWFAKGENAGDLSHAPSLVFDRNDRLQEKGAPRDPQGPAPASPTACRPRRPSSMGRWRGLAGA